MKKIISAVLSAAIVLSCGAAAAAAIPGDDAPAPMANTKPVILKEIYEAEDAGKTGGTVGADLDDYHGTGYVTGLGRGEDINFEVDVPTAGKYGVKIRYSNGTGANRTVGVYVNGASVRNATLAPGINEDTWAYQTEAVELSAGKNTITLKGTASVDGVSFDRIALSWLFEAEEAAKIGNANDNQDQHPGYSGSGFASGYGSSGYGRRFTVNVPEAGQYTLVMRYAAGQTNSEARSVSLVVNGQRTQVQLNTLRSWDLWWDHTSTVTLRAGENTISVERQGEDNGEINLDYITVKPVQWTYAGAIEKIDGNGTEQLTLTLDNSMVQITSVDKNAVKVWLEPESRFDRLYESFAIQNEAVNPQELDAKDKGDYYEIDTGDMTMRLQKNPFKITYLDKKGNVIMENTNESMGWTTDGELMVNNVMDEDEAFWGLGENQTAFNRRGQRLYMWAVDTWGSAPDDSMPSWEEGRYSMSTPYFVSSKGYSIFFDNTSRTVFDFGKTEANTASFGTVNPNPGGELLYYFIYGGSDNNSIKKVTKTYTDMVGKSFFAPDWAMGNMQCHYGYLQSDVQQVAQAYRDNEIPLDMIMIDIEWYASYCTPTAWHSSNFPDPEGMIQFLHDRNIRLGVIDDPNISSTGNRDFAVADANGYLVKDQTGNTKLIDWPWDSGASGLMDFFNPDAREWWGELHNMILDQGVEGFWLDMCEPSKYNADWLFYNEDGKSYGSMSEVKNALAIMHQTAMFEKLHEDGERSFMTSRTGYNGTHRYSAIWTGDINCGWESQNYQINIGTSLSMSGYNYWGFDIGGFFGDASDEQFKRMVELATFTPVHRFHYMTGGPKEAYTHNATEVSKKYINLRYRLMPYTYSMTADNIIGIGIENGLGEGGTGVPVVRALAMNYPTDANTYNIDDQYMSGDTFLLAPVVEASETKEVYFPEGQWYDYADGKTIYGGNQTITYDAPVDLLPIFVKAGSIVPMMPEMQYVGEKPIDEITLDIYPTTEDGSFNFVMYEDDGESEDYLKGEYTTTAYDCDVVVGPKQDTITLNIGERTGTYTDIDERNYMMQFHAADYANLKVELDGKALTKAASLEALNAAEEGYYADKSGGICYVKVDDTAKAMQVVVTGDTGTNTAGIRLEAEEAELTGVTADTEDETGYVDGFKADSKVTFQTFEMPEAGKYPVYISYKTADKDATVTLSAGENSVSVKIADSDAWTAALALLPLAKGENTITLSADKDILIDRIVVKPGAVSYDPLGTITAEAEDGSLTGCTASIGSGADYSGTGFVPLESNGASVAFDNVNVLTDGTYAVSIRYSEGATTLAITAGDTTETIDLPSVQLGLWSVETVNLPLKAGVNTITVTRTSGNKMTLDCLMLDTDPYALTAAKELTNKGFDAGSITGWKMDARDNRPNNGYGVDAGDNFAGGRKFYFWDGDSRVDKILHQTVTGIENGRYMVRARIKVYNTNPEICQFYITGYDGDAVTTTDIPYTSIWTTLFSDIVEVKDGQIDIGFYYKAPSGASLQIDDVTLWKVTDEAEPSKALLTAAVERAEEMDKADYTADSWDAYQLALILAEEVLADEAATSDEIYGMLQYVEGKEDALLTTAEGDAIAAAAVDAKIDALGVITSLEQEGAVAAARKAYDKLTDAQKELVTKLAVLEDAEKEIERIKNGEPAYEKGDVDKSSKVDVADIMKLKALIMADKWTDEELSIGDMDNSKALDVGDIMAVKNIIMSK